MFYRLACVIAASAILLVLLSPAISGQMHSPSRLQFSEDAPCTGEMDAPLDHRRAVRISFVSYLRSANECAASEPGHWRTADAPTWHRPDVAPPQPVDDELPLLGSAGFAIARARLQVLQILRENSSCSYWYAQAEENPQSKFASLHYRIDANGEDTAIGEYNSRGLSFREPYVASAQQSVGPGSIITLNVHGAFFVLRAPFKVRWGDGGRLVQRLP